MLPCSPFLKLEVNHRPGRKASGLYDLDCVHMSLWQGRGTVLDLDEGDGRGLHRVFTILQDFCESGHA